MFSINLYQIRYLCQVANFYCGVKVVQDLAKAVLGFPDAGSVADGGADGLRGGRGGAGVLGVNADLVVGALGDKEEGFAFLKNIWEIFF